MQQTRINWFKELSLHGCTFTCNQYTLAGVYKGVYCQCQLSSTLIAMCQTWRVRIMRCFCVPSGIKWQCCNMSKVKGDTSARCWPCQTLRPRLPSACSGAVELNKSPFWKDVLNDTTQFRVPRDTAEDAAYATLTNLKHVLRQPGCQERSPLFTRLASMLALIRLFRFHNGHEVCDHRVWEHGGRVVAAEREMLLSLSLFKVKAAFMLCHPAASSEYEWGLG